MSNALAIVIEGLGTGLLGCYGSNTAVTPNVDRLAAQGMVLDQCFLDSHDKLYQLRSLWSGCHALQSDTSTWNFWQAGQANAAGCLLTDCPETAEEAERWGCEQIVLVPSDMHDQPCEDVSDCAAMPLFAAAAQELASGREGVLWIHSRGLHHRWDAPLDLRERFVDPEDPLPPSDTVLPTLSIDSQTDPDLLVGWGQVAAAQSSVLDQAIGVLLDTIEQRPDRNSWSCLLLSLGGVPLGEHGVLGWGRPQLYGEELSCAAVFRPGDTDGGSRRSVGVRRSELCQLPDLGVSLAELAGISSPAALHASSSDASNASTPAIWGRSALGLRGVVSPEHWSALHQSALTRMPVLCRSNSRDSTLDTTPAESQLWFRTPAWSLQEDLNQSVKLFVKPDDRWEVSEIADRRADVVDAMLEAAEMFERALAANDRSQLKRLDEVLCQLMR